MRVSDTSSRYYGASVFNRRVEIFEVVETQDSETGQVTKALKSKGLAGARIRPVRGWEKRRSGREEMAQREADVDLRWHGDLKVTDLLKFDGYLWGITSLSAIGRMNRDYIEVSVECLETDGIIGEG